MSSTPDHARLFAFESDFVDSLRCVPMAVRFKLDLAGIKLSLRQWSRFTVEDRHRLLVQSCQTATEVAAYAEVLTELIAERTGEPAAPLPEPPSLEWMENKGVPPAVARRARLSSVRGLTDAEWARLSDLERFALLKLSRDNHDNVNFVPALREFGLLVG